MSQTFPDNGVRTGILHHSVVELQGASVKSLEAVRRSGNEREHFLRQVELHQGPHFSVLLPTPRSNLSVHNESAVSLVTCTPAHVRVGSAGRTCYDVDVRDTVMWITGMLQNVWMVLHLVAKHFWEETECAAQAGELPANGFPYASERIERIKETSIILQTVPVQGKAMASA